MTGKLPEFFGNRPLWVVIAVAVIIRIVYLLIYISRPEWNQLLVDSLFHDRWAMSIASGDVIGSDVYFRAPFYIYLLAAIYSVFSHSLLAARIMGHIIGLLSVLVTFALARRLFSKRTAVIAGLIHALYPVAIYFESELLVESLFTFLLELSVLCFFYARERDGIKWPLLTGLALGLAAITRPVVLPLIALYVIWIFPRRGGLGPSIRSSALLIAGVMIMIIPVTARNLIVADDFVPVASSGGINFYIGNNSAADGLSASMPPPLGNTWQIRDINHLAEKEAGKKLKASEVSDFWYGKGLAWIMANKADFLRLYLKKLYFSINNFEVSNNRDLTLFFKGNVILHFNPLDFGLIFGLSVMAILMLIFQKRFTSDILFVAVLTVLYIFMISFFFINARFRLPVVPFVIILAAEGISGSISAVRASNKRWLGVIAILVGAGALFFSNTNLYGIDKSEISNGLYNQANYYLFKNDTARAIQLYRRVLSEDPRYPECNLNMGAAFLRRGQGDSAEYYFRREVDIDPANARGYANLASIHYLKKTYNLAEAEANSAIQLRPELIDGYLIKLRVQAALNDSNGIGATLAMAEKNLGDRPRLYLEAGLAYSQWNLFDRAEPLLKAVLAGRGTPAETDDNAFTYSDLGGTGSFERLKARAAYQLGYIYGLRQELRESIKMSSLALSLDSGLAEAYVNLAFAYLTEGDRALARSVIGIALRKFPADSRIRALEERLK